MEVQLPSPALAAVGIWGLSQQVEVLSCESLIFMLMSYVHIFPGGVVGVWALSFWGTAVPEAKVWWQVFGLLKGSWDG